MSLTGDLSTLDLGDLIQNLETHRRTGVLTVEAEGGTVQLFFREGRLSLFGKPGRASLMQVLVACGAISMADLEAAKKKGRRAHKSLGEVLVSARKIDFDALKSIASSRLLDEACELVATAGGAFTFTQGGVPRGVFDPEERVLGLSLAAGPLLMEAARREDHWKLIRERVPSDSVHYMVQRKPGGDTTELGAHLLARLDGTRSVAEAMTSFPHRRFEAYQTLAHFVDTRVVRMAGADELGRFAKELARHDSLRAWEIVLRALETHPQHVGLLSEQVSLASQLAYEEVAGEALRMLVHIHLETGDRAQATQELKRAHKLDPDGLWIWERTFALAREDGRHEDALAAGKRLAELYRRPGLHQKAASVFEALLEERPDDWELRLELARSLADCGDLASAYKEIDRHGRKLVAAEDYLRAQLVYEAALELDPANASAKEVLARLRSGLIERRRARRRRIGRSLVRCVIGVLLVAFIGFEVASRRAFDLAASTISSERLIEERRYAEALRHYEEVVHEYPSATTSLFEAARRIEELKRKLAAGE